MSRVFRRPMFRKGGGVNMNGVMSGIQDTRENYFTGTPSPESYADVELGLGNQTMADFPISEGGTKPESTNAGIEGIQLPDAEGRFREALAKYKDTNMGIDPIYQLLIQGGLRGMSTAGKGGTLANLASAFEEPTGQFFAAQKARKEFDRDMDLAATKLGIEDDQLKASQALKKYEIDMKAKGGDGSSRFQKDYSLDRKNFELYKIYADPDVSAFNRKIENLYPENYAEYMTYMQKPIKDNFDTFMGVIPHDIKSGRINFDYDALQIGGAYFNPQDKTIVIRTEDKIQQYNPYTKDLIKEVDFKKS